MCQLPLTDATIKQHFSLTRLENKQDAFLSSANFAKFVGNAKRCHIVATAYPRDVLYEK